MEAGAEAGARGALAAFIEAWNAADLEAVRATLNYPHLTVGPSGEVFVANAAAEFTTDFARLRENEGWYRSTLDLVDVVDSSPAKVHCVAGYSRYRPDGTRYSSGRVLYAVTLRDGRWGMQMRSTMGAV
jgi:hypothetical protein